MSKEKQMIDYSSMSYDELSELSNDDHRQDTKEYDKQQNALALVMIGSLLLVCGIIFLILSNRKVMNNAQGIDTSSLQFFVSLACFGIAVILLSYGLTRFFIALYKRIQLRKEIMQISSYRKEYMKSEQKEETLK
jgi:hypothetical protein